MWERKNPPRKYANQSNRSQTGWAFSLNSVRRGHTFVCALIEDSGRGRPLNGKSMDVIDGIFKEALHEEMIYLGRFWLYLHAIIS